MLPELLGAVRNKAAYKTPVVAVLVVSKSLKAGQGPHAGNRREGLAAVWGTFHSRVRGMQKFLGSSPKVRPWAWTTPGLGGRGTASAAYPLPNLPAHRAGPQATLPPGSLKMPGKKNKTSPQTSPHWNAGPALLRRSGSEVMSGFYSIS